MNQDLSYYAKLLRDDEVVAFPTETVYGLGADAWSPSAVRKIFEVKGRPNDNPLIVHVCDIEMARTFFADWPEDARKLAKAFWPGPLTLVLPKRPEVLDAVTAGLDTVALRMPSHPMALDLIRKTGPLVAPSANTSGRPSPTTAQHVLDDFGADFPVVDGGACRIGLESTVLNLSSRPYEILRPGYVSPKAIGEVLGEKPNQYGSHDHERPLSPGMKYSHYAPKATVRWMEDGEQPGQTNTLYLLHRRGSELSAPNIIHYQNDFSQMAHELYDRFRQADHGKYQFIAVEPLSDPELRNRELIDALINRIDKASGDIS